MFYCSNYIEYVIDWGKCATRPFLAMWKTSMKCKSCSSEVNIMKWNPERRCREELVKTWRKWPKSGKESWFLRAVENIERKFDEIEGIVRSRYAPPALWSSEIILTHKPSGSFTRICEACCRYQIRQQSEFWLLLCSHFISSFVDFASSQRAFRLRKHYEYSINRKFVHTHSHFFVLLFLFFFHSFTKA